MSETPGSAKAVVAGHGEFASGLVSAVQQITGLGDRFVAVSNTGLGLAEVEGALRSALEESGARIIFTDLPAGSCTMAACRIARGDASVVVITGVALPTLLSFAFGGDLTDAVARGRESMKRVEAPRGA